MRGPPPTEPPTKHRTFKLRTNPSDEARAALAYLLLKIGLLSAVRFRGGVGLKWRFIKLKGPEGRQYGSTIQ